MKSKELGNLAFNKLFKRAYTAEDKEALEAVKEFEEQERHENRLQHYH
jgi:hypothetical protein